MIATEIKQLPLEIHRRGATYRQIKRGAKALIYVRTVRGEARSYETFLVHTREQQRIKGKLAPAGEVFPHDEAFGYWAWISYSIERANEKFDSLELS